MEVCVSFPTSSLCSGCLLSSNPSVFFFFILLLLLLSGTTTLHKELEESVANFVGKPAAIVFGMGYATNAATLPVLIGKVFA